MKNCQAKLLCAFLSIFLLFIFPCTTYARSMIEPCSSSDACNSLLSYILPYDLKLSEIAYRFQVNITDILAANSINPTTPSNQIFHTNYVLKIPISCPCVDGIRRSMSTTYMVNAADSVDSISQAYGGLVSAEQISTTNGVSAKSPLTIGQRIVIPLPCTCFGNRNNGVTAVYMSYVVQMGESLDRIAMEFGTTIVNLEVINGLGQPVAYPGDILAIPISACSSANLNWYNESLIVPNGSYALTANNCIKCICESGNLNLHCLPSGIVPSCSHLQCKGYKLFIGDAYVTHTAIGCNISACMYRGHNGRKIFRSFANSINVQCPGSQTDPAMSPTASPSMNPIVPSIILPPYLSPYSAPYPAMGSDGSGQNSYISGDGGLASWYNLLLLEGVVYSIFLMIRSN